MKVGRSMQDLEAIIHKNHKYSNQQLQTKLAASLKGRSKISYNTEAPSPAKQTLTYTAIMLKQSFPVKNIRLGDQIENLRRNKDQALPITQSKFSRKRQAQFLVNSKETNFPIRNCLDLVLIIAKKLTILKGFSSIHFLNKKNFFLSRQRLNKKARSQGQGPIVLVVSNRFIEVENLHMDKG